MWTSYLFIIFVVVAVFALVFVVLVLVRMFPSLNLAISFCTEKNSRCESSPNRHKKKTAKISRMQVFKFAGELAFFVLSRHYTLYILNKRGRQAREKGQRGMWISCIRLVYTSGQNVHESQIENTPESVLCILGTLYAYFWQSVSASFQSQCFSNVWAYTANFDKGRERTKRQSNTETERERGIKRDR